MTFLELRTVQSNNVNGRMSCSVRFANQHCLKKECEAYVSTLVLHIYRVLKYGQAYNVIPNIWLLERGTPVTPKKSIDTYLLDTVLIWKVE